MGVRLTDLRTDHLVAPLAVPTVAPSFSWEIESDERDVRQTAMRIRVSTAHGRQRLVWDSGVIGSDRSGTEYAGPALRTSTAYLWTAESHLAGGEVVTADATFEVGPSTAAWDTASWITIPRPPTFPVDHHPAPYLRKTLELAVPVERARLFATAGGVFQAWLNGTAVSELDLAPGWTDYRYRVPFHAYDVTAQLRTGSNTVGAVVGEGWYSGYVGPFGKRAHWGETPVFRALLEITDVEGARHVVTTDASWEGAHGAVLLAEILHGERVDRRQELPGWSEGADDRRWRPVVVGRGPAGKLVPAKIEAVGGVREVQVADISEKDPGSYIVDFGQNFAGRVRMRARGPAGTAISIRHAEILDRDGRLYVDNLRTAMSTDRVVLDGSGEEEFEPRFTFHGFRYAEVSGYPGRPTKEDFAGIATSSIRNFDLEFDTDHELVNDLQRNLQWTMLSNFLEVPMDCPNRDERLGWGGDAHVFAPTAMMNADLHAFYAKWLDDIADAQKPNGAFADIAPGVIVDFAEEGAAGYADAGVFLPWQMWEHYGDRRVLEEFVDRGERWLDFVLSFNPDHLWREHRNADYGDWISTVQTDKVLVATAYWARAAVTVARGAEVLGRVEQAERCHVLFSRIASAFREEFLDDDGHLRERTQTAAVLALEFELLSGGDRNRAADLLVADVEDRGHLTVGFLAVRHALPALCSAGRPDLAFRMLLRTEAPSWGDQIARGLTTIGEHWSAWGPDGELLDPWMNSFNHFALGAVGEWLYREVGGVAAVEPGFARIRVAPRITGPIGRSRLRFRSPRGPIECRWEHSDDAFTMSLEVPANCRATVVLPAADVEESGSPVPAVALSPDPSGGFALEVPSGRYEFVVRGAAR